MIYLDSWVWLEYGLQGDQWETARDLIDDAIANGGTVSTIALTEIDYILSREVDRTTADLVTSAIEDFERINVVPASPEVALYASRLRRKYDGQQDNAFSYADATHIATADLVGCEALHTGDSDFASIEEIETVVH